MPNLPLLRYLNLRSNKISEYANFNILTEIKSLASLNAQENPCAEEGDAKKEILMMLPQLVRCIIKFY